MFCVNWENKFAHRLRHQQVMFCRQPIDDIFFFASKQSDLESWSQETLIQDINLGFHAIGYWGVSE